MLNVFPNFKLICLSNAFLLLFTAFTIGVYAQKLQPAKATLSYENAQPACWVVHVDPEPVTLKKAWREYLKDNYSFKLKGIGFLSNKDILSAEAVRIPVISKEPVNFYTQIVEDDTGSEMKIFAADLQQNYFSSHYQSRGFNQMENILASFLKIYLPEYHRGRINDTEQRVKELVRETRELEEEILENTEEIEELENEIEEMSAEIESNRSALVESRIKLEKRRAKLERKRSQLQDI
jgi:hypothetical protein